MKRKGSFARPLRALLAGGLFALCALVFLHFLNRPQIGLDLRQAVEITLARWSDNVSAYLPEKLPMEYLFGESLLEFVVDVFLMFLLQVFKFIAVIVLLALELTLPSVFRVFLYAIPLFAGIIFGLICFWEVRDCFGGIPTRKNDPEEDEFEDEFPSLY